MENGNYGGSEFGWDYSMGGQGQGMSGYSQGSYGGSGGYGGRQWLHSNQANSQQYAQQGMQQGSFPTGIAEYNQSMLRYSSFPKTADTKSEMYSIMGGGGGGGSGQGMSMTSMSGGGGGGENYYGGYSGMSNNGLGSPGQGQGQGNQGYSSSWF
ncbi:RNA-binding protein FUS isoform X2 [Scaptodrosophila lebanonensis]|uniref:RNA-binding protein FUS isoform X2 n=1 Tax=Drosophila lebanonensis TaxID=7225 RepID=A0A6J2UAL1_DROLE|nr:RNA-binding protein FUS isoform X2 [Scaptodrosophila lebanonensis]